MNEGSNFANSELNRSHRSRVRTARMRGYAAQGQHRRNGPAEECTLHGLLLELMVYRRLLCIAWAKGKPPSPSPV
jgi:hypothetical protein